MPPLKVTVTKAEREALSQAAAHYSWAEDKLGQRVLKGLRSLLEKVEKAEAPEKQTKEHERLGLVAAEVVLKGVMGDRYAPWVGGNPGRVVKDMQLVGITGDRLETVGRWLATQDWVAKFYPEGVTLPTIVRKWAEWAPRALAAGQKSVPAGLPASSWSDE